MDKKMTSGEIAKKAGISQKAVRLYDEKELLKPVEYSPKCNGAEISREGDFWKSISVKSKSLHSLTSFVMNLRMRFLKCSVSVTRRAKNICRRTRIKSRNISEIFLQKREKFLLQ